MASKAKNTLLVNLDEETRSIQVKTSDEDNPQTIAVGNFAVDAPDRTALIAFDGVSVRADDYEQLDQLLSTVFSHVGQLYKGLVCIRLPRSFDQQLDPEKLQFRTDVSTVMVAAMDHLTYEPTQPLLGQYELILDRQTMQSHAPSIQRLMTSNAFWASHWQLEETRQRIVSGTGVAMVLDTSTNVPCAFGRVFMLSSANHERLGYLTDIVVDQPHQSKGLGRVILNYLLQTSVQYDSQSHATGGTLCLQCADQGSGAIPAPKLYSRAGFECPSATGNRTAMFASKQYYVKPSEDV